MGFFSSSKPQVTHTEFQKVKRELHSKGWSEHDLDTLEKQASGHLHEEGWNKGIDRKELEKMVKGLDKKTYDYGVSHKQVKEAGEALKKRL
ncbi:hypothetical protein A2930_01440 [Candidatus Giovannonibacteria bacterium RIFCSPLOWO2_01_FULL_45_34]|uniref:Uncharacterized protein n=1 Tax=Candidatus Giovannonibacteria bacterium RIFCSPLOWO2_01_FULL_45_34 TaxID=1798351 RepID=A0A1F5X1N2_9BACT|nr:MAG: hypothetical protein A2930_01440 [Candidatus Giovannonibacteria bacterium RIFCSPLOWO2_01_FULL_45_34]